MSAEELAAMDAKIVADTIAEMQRQIEQLTGARHSMYDPAVAIARDIANRTPPAMSADHIGDAGNMVAPVEAVAWRFWHEGGWNFSLADPSPHLADCVERDALYTHPAPIKPSGDTGELRDRVARIIDPSAFLFSRDELDAKVRHHPHDAAYALADAILSLIQSERGGA